MVAEIVEALVETDETWVKTDNVSDASEAPLCPLFPNIQNKHNHELMMHGEVVDWSSIHKMNKLPAQRSVVNFVNNIHGI